jgi:pyruvate ferredoxin oxidoreductase delta subunit
MNDGLKKWQELAPGGVITQSGNAADYETGTWRTWRPIWKEAHCIHCLTCWVFCPEDAYQLKDGTTPRGKKRKEICEVNYFHCKGCGLCVRECPVNKKGKDQAIEFIREET